MKKLAIGVLAGLAAAVVATPYAVPALAQATSQTLCGNDAWGTAAGPDWFSLYQRGSVTNPDGTNKSCLTLLPEPGHYSTTWELQAGGNIVNGKGWFPGTPTRKVGYKAAAFTQDDTTFLSLYGWTQDPIIEYYVTESWGDYRPVSGVFLGTVRSDGGTYDIYKEDLNGPNITGVNGPFTQIRSVRRTKARLSATRANGITFANHVAAWRKYGFNLGTTWSYQIMATEAYGGGGTRRGTSDVTVSEL